MGDTEESCAHQPQAGTAYTAANLAARYARTGEPVDAMCSECGLPIRVDEYRVPGPRGRWRLKYAPPDVEERAAGFRERHPGITVRPGCRSAVWHDDDGVHEVSYGNPRDLIDRLEREFDRRN